MGPARGGSKWEQGGEETTSIRARVEAAAARVMTGGAPALCQAADRPRLCHAARAARAPAARVMANERAQAVSGCCSTLAHRYAPPSRRVM